MKKKQFIWVLLLPLTIALLAACSKTQDTKTKTTLNYGSTKDVGNLNPHLYNGEMAAQNMIYERLVTSDGTKIKPNLASSWEISEDGKTYTFHIRKNVKF